MLLAPRNVTFALVAALALCVTGCKSNNEGKIVGKWASTNGVVFEFTADGQFIASGAGPTIQGRYSLGTGDTVYLNNLDPPIKNARKTRERITIIGDSMNVAGGRDTPPKAFTRVQ